MSKADRQQRLSELKTAIEQGDPVLSVQSLAQLKQLLRALPQAKHKQPNVWPQEIEYQLLVECLCASNQLVARTAVDVLQSLVDAQVLTAGTASAQLVYLTAYAKHPTILVNMLCALNMADDELSVSDNALVVFCTKQQTLGVNVLNVLLARKHPQLWRLLLRLSVDNRLAVHSRARLLSAVPPPTKLHRPLLHFYASAQPELASALVALLPADDQSTARLSLSLDGVYWSAEALDQQQLLAVVKQLASTPAAVELALLLARASLTGAVAAQHWLPIAAACISEAGDEWRAAVAAVLQPAVMRLYALHKLMPDADQALTQLKQLIQAIDGALATPAPTTTPSAASAAAVCFTAEQLLPHELDCYNTATTGNVRCCDDVTALHCLCARVLLSPDAAALTSTCQTLAQRTPAPMVSYVLPVLLRRFAKDAQPEHKDIVLRALPALVKNRTNVPAVLKLLLQTATAGRPAALHSIADLCQRYPRCLEQVDPDRKLLEYGGKWDTNVMQFIQRLADECADEMGEPLLAVLSKVIGSAASDGVKAQALRACATLVNNEVADIALLRSSLARRLQPSTANECVRSAWCQLLAAAATEPDCDENDDDDGGHSADEQRAAFDMERDACLAELFAFALDHGRSATVATAAWQALAAFDPANHFRLKHLPQEVKTELFVNPKLSDESAVPPSVLLQYIIEAGQQCWAGTEQLLSRMLRLELAALPRSVYKQKAQPVRPKAQLQLIELADFVYKLNRPNMQLERWRIAVFLLHCYEPGTVVTYGPAEPQSSADNRRVAVRYARQYSDTLSRLLQHTPLEPQDWRSFVAALHGWGPFMQRMYAHAVKARQCELSLEAEGRGCTAEELAAGQQQAWLYVRDRLGDQLDSHFKQNIRAQINCCLALAALALAVDQYASEQGMEANASSSHQTQSHWLRNAFESLMQLALRQKYSPPAGCSLLFKQLQWSSLKPPVSVVATVAAAQLCPLLLHQLAKQDHPFDRLFDFVRNDADKTYPIGQMCYPMAAAHLARLPDLRAASVCLLLDGLQSQSGGGAAAIGYYTALPAVAAYLTDAQVDSVQRAFDLLGERDMAYDAAQYAMFSIGKRLADLKQPDAGEAPELNVGVGGQEEQLQPKQFKEFLNDSTRFSSLSALQQSSRIRRFVAQALLSFELTYLLECIQLLSVCLKRHLQTDDNPVLSKCVLLSLTRLQVHYAAVQSARGSSAHLPLDYAYLPESSLLRALVHAVKLNKHNDDDCSRRFLQCVIGVRCASERRLPPLQWHTLLSHASRAGLLSAEWQFVLGVLECESALVATANSGSGLDVEADCVRALLHNHLPSVAQQVSAELFNRLLAAALAQTDSSSSLPPNLSTGLSDCLRLERTAPAVSQAVLNTLMSHMKHQDDEQQSAALIGLLDDALLRLYATTADAPNTTRLLQEAAARLDRSQSAALFELVLVGCKLGDAATDWAALLQAVETVLNNEQLGWPCAVEVLRRCVARLDSEQQAVLLHSLLALARRTNSARGSDLLAVAVVCCGLRPVGLSSSAAHLLAGFPLSLHRLLHANTDEHNAKLCQPLAQIFVQSLAALRGSSDGPMWTQIIESAVMALLSVAGHNSAVLRVLDEARYFDAAF